MTETKGFAEELVDLFATWGYMRQELRDAFTQRGADEMARQFGIIEGVLHGLEYTAEDSLGLGAYVVLGDAKKLAEAAREVCERYVR
jgi:hypothetical protein